MANTRDSAKDQNLDRRTDDRPTAATKGAIYCPKAVVTPPNDQSINHKRFTGNRHMLVRKLATLALGGNASVSTAQLVDSFAETPSSQLRLALTVAINLEGVTPYVGDPAFGTGLQPTLVVSTMARHPDNGTLAFLKGVFTSTVPDGYEADTAAPIHRVTVGNIKSDMLVKAYIGAYNAGIAKRATINLIASWEPNQPMTDVEAQRLFALCKLYGPNTYYTSSAPSTFGPETVIEIQATTDT